ncbi:MAG TPA: Ig-like domain-containing protein [Gemmatimonadaceae bacterium]|jgi:hypothetical protein
MRNTVRHRRSWLRWVVLAAVYGCGGGAATDVGSTSTNTTTKPAVLTSLAVTLSASTLQVGQSTTASATGVDQNGAAISTGTVTWTSSNPTIASVTSAGAVTGLAAGTTNIVATAQGVTGQSPLTVIVAPPVGANSVTLSAAGQSTSFLTAPNPNVALTVNANDQYLIEVVNTDPSYNSTEDVTITGSGSGALANVTPSAARAAPSIATEPAARSLTMSAARVRALDAARAVDGRTANHLAMLENNRQIFASHGNPKRLWAAARSGRTAPIGAAVVQSIGAVNKVYVAHSLNGSCTEVDSIGARTVAIGQHVIVLADTNSRTWPSAFRPDSSYYQFFATEFDQLTYPHILANIGDPLAYDSQLSGIGKITVTITPVLNNLSGATGGGSVVAFVNGCDFFPTALSGPDADLSNETEMFYSWVPSSSGDDVASWELELRATAAHETKHIVSYTDRILNNSANFEEVWLEEGLAQESSEIWERNFNEATWKGNATFDQTVACEISLGANAPCDLAGTKPIALIASHLPFFFQYLQTESSSHSEGLGLDTPADYGAGWTFARWATDQYGTTEAAFIKSLVNEPQLTGLDNLSRHTLQSSQLLLVYWNLATAIFQSPTYTIADVRATIPSFNFADIFKVGQTGLQCGSPPRACGFFTTSGSPVFPVQPIALTAGTFANTVHGVPGTSAVFYLLSASTAGTETIQLSNSTGSALSTSSGLRVAILRVR